MLSSHAQDTLLVRNGKTLKVQVVQTDSNKILYRKLKTNAKVKAIRVREVIAIKYQNGAKDVFINPPRLYHHQLLSDYDRSMQIADKKFKSGGGLIGMGSTFLTIGTSMVIGGIYLYQSENQNSLGGLMLGFFGCLFTAAGIPPLTVGVVQIKRAKIQRSNAQLLKRELSFNPVLQPASQSFGLVPGLGFNFKF